MMSTPKVSVVVPVYNTEKYLKQCVDSLISQTLEDIEIILVDDGSKDVCASLCDKLAMQDVRIKVVHKENQGLGLARNTGIKASSGEYVGFVDSDDYVEKEMFERLYDAAQRNDADLAISGISFVDGNTFGKKGEHEKKHCFEKETVFDSSAMKDLLFGVVGALPHEPEDSRYGVSVCKNIFRRKLFFDENIEFLSERKIISEDTVFMVDFIKHTKKAVGIHGAFYCYRRNEQSLSKSYRSDRYEKVIIFIDELEKHLMEQASKQEYGIYLDRLTQSYGRFLCSHEIMHAIGEKISYRDLKKQLKKICTDEKISGALKKYPWHKLPKKQAAFAFAMKHKLYFLQKLMVRLRAR